MLDRLDTPLEQIFRTIHTGVYCFIDTVEQGVSNMDRPAWMHLQAGLIEAAWDVMTSNNHIKIYAGIREEAFAGYTSDSKINLFSAVLSLRYSPDELHQMMDSLSILYECESSFHQFVGRSHVRNMHCGVEEEAFRYVHRHRVGRPRDLVVICFELSRNRSQDSEERFCETVNRTASNVLLPLVFSEMGVILDCLQDETERTRFFGLLSHNILSDRKLKQCVRPSTDTMSWIFLNCTRTVSILVIHFVSCSTVGSLVPLRKTASTVRSRRNFGNRMT